MATETDIKLHCPRTEKQIYRGYLTFSVLDRFLFHRMSNKSSIFTSGEATSENTAFSVHEKHKKRSFTEKVKFSISFLLENCNNLVYSNASAVRTETQPFS